MTKPKIIISGVLAVTIMSTTGYLIRRPVFRRLAIATYSRDTQYYYGKTEYAILLLRWVHQGSPERLDRLMHDPDRWIRFLAAYEVICIAGAPYRQGGWVEGATEFLVPRNGIATQQVDRAFQILRDGFSASDPDTRCIRNWVADHFPPVLDRRTVILMSEALAEPRDGPRAFAEMLLENIMGPDSRTESGGRWQEWIGRDGSNLVWNGNWFVVTNRISTETRGVEQNSVPLPPVP